MTDLKTPEARKAGSDIPPALVGTPYVFYRDEDSISLIEVVRALYAERWVIVGIVALSTLVSLIPASMSTRIYRAEVLLAPVALDKSDGVSALLGQFGELSTLVERYIGGTKDQTAESIATLRSRSLGVDFIREHRLKPLLFAEHWDAEQQKWRDTVEKPPTDLDAYGVFDGQVRRVEVERRSGLVTLGIEWREPEAAAAWANALVRKVNERRRAEAIREARQSIKHLEQQLRETSSVEIRQSIYRLIEAQTKAVALANAREEYAFKVIDPAVRPEHPIRPKPLVMVVGGFLAGTILAGFVVLIRRAVKQHARAIDPLV